MCPVIPERGQVAAQAAQGYTGRNREQPINTPHWNTNRVHRGAAGEATPCPSRTATGDRPLRIPAPRAAKAVGCFAVFIVDMTGYGFCCKKFRFSDSENLPLADGPMSAASSHRTNNSARPGASRAEEKPLDGSHPERLMEDL